MSSLAGAAVLLDPWAGNAAGAEAAGSPPATVPPAALPPTTVGRLRRDMAARFRAAWGDDDGDRTPALDARLLLAHALGIESSRLNLREDEAVDGEAAAGVWRLAERRLAGEPVARILGTKDFWSLAFSLSPATLVPRPDTETLVAAAIDALAASGRKGAPLTVLDLGTGSGCILLALLSELPNARGLGIDRAPEAVATASANAAQLGLGQRARFSQGDWAEGLSGRFDVVVANPPYIKSDVMAGLPEEVREHDPWLALDGGPDGLDPYRVIVPELPGLLNPAGFAVLEFGPGQAGAIASLAAANGLVAEIRQDLAGRQRAAFLTLSNEAALSTPRNSLEKADEAATVRHTEANGGSA